MTEVSNAVESWLELKDLVQQGNPEAVSNFIDRLSSRDIARALARLDEETRQKLFALLDPIEAANLVEELPTAQAADLIEDLSDEQAAAIVDELASDQQADILAALPEENKEAILQEMDPEEARDARQLLSYPSDTAGGIMVTEYISYPEHLISDDLLMELRRNSDKYAKYEILYAYIVDSEGHLTGVVKLRDLIFCAPDTRLSSIMIRDPVCARVDSSLEDLETLFDRYDFFGVPVVDKKGRLVGLIRRGDLREALQNKAGSTFLKAAGIVGGEELRTMPVATRSTRRLSILIVNVGLNLLSASVIAAHQDTLQAFITLAVFLPMISDLSGCSGNQAIAVSIRELALGLVRPHEVLLVVMKELRVGIINGLALGGVLALIAMIWKGDPYLSLIVGSTLILNICMAVVVGGTLPLLLKRIRVDPAIASAPILTTCTDMCGFFVALSTTSALLPLMAGS